MVRWLIRRYGLTYEQAESIAIDAFVKLGKAYHDGHPVVDPLTRLVRYAVVEVFELKRT